MAQNLNCGRCGLPFKEGTGGICHSCLLKGVLQSREEEIQEEVLKLGTVDERTAFVQGVCGDDPALCDRMLAWLARRNVNGADRPGLPDEDQEPDGFNGRYKLLRKLGEGGFGVVYLAEQTEPVQRTVALKIIKLGMETKQVVARFETERQALALMDHPNIAKVLDAGTTESGRPYFVMELVWGAPITQYCDQSRLTTHERLGLFVQVCHAVQHAHQKGIIHRDLKPSNILVSTTHETPTPKVIDFGIAKAAQQEFNPHTALTQFHQFIGTPAYISPEQADLTRSDIDTRSDIYSLGVLLCELLTGRTPLDNAELLASGFDQMCRAIREKEPARPSRMLDQAANPQGAEAVTGAPRTARNRTRQRLSSDLDWIVLKCLQKDRTRRYATANGLAMDVQRHLNNETVLARPPSIAYRCSRLVLRNPIASALAVLLFFSLTTALLVSIAMGLRMTSARHETEQSNRRLKETIRHLEWQKAEEFATEGRRYRALAWFASLLRENPNDATAASRVISMLTMHSFALPLTKPLLHNGTVTRSQFSPDGTQVLTASADRTVRFWETRTGRLLRVFTNQSEVISAAYLTKGTQFLAVTQDGIARVYDTRTGMPLMEVPQLRSGLNWIGNGEAPWLFCLHEDNHISRWNLSSQRQVEPPWRFSSPVERTASTKTGERIALAFADRTICILASNAAQPQAFSKPFETMIESIEFTADGHRLFISLNEGKRVLIWDYENGNDFTEFIPPSPALMSTLGFTPDGTRLITRAWADPIRVWDAKTLQQIGSPTVPDQGATFFSLNKESSLIGFYTQRGIVRVLDAKSGEPLLEPLEHQGPVTDLDFHPDGTVLVSASQDGTARLWDVRMRNPAQLLLPAATGGGEATLSPDGTRVIVSVRENAVQVCALATGQPISPILEHPAGGEPTIIGETAFSPDGSRILTADWIGLVRVWDAATFHLQSELQVGQPVVVSGFSKDGNFIVTGDRGGFVRIWDAQNGRLMSTCPRQSGEVIGLDFDPAGHDVVTACTDGTARFWTLPNGEPAGDSLKHKGIIWSALFSPNGNRVVTASADRTAQVWDVATRQPLHSPLRHEKDVLSAHFSPDGKWILTTSEDGTARVWDSDTGVPISYPMQHAAKIWRGCFSPDGRCVATGSDDRSVRVWDAQSGLPLSEALLHPGSISRLNFTQDGHHVLSFGGDRARLWELTFAPTPTPAWFCDLIEAVAGFRLQAGGQIIPASPEIIVALRERLADQMATDFYSRWARWFLLDRMETSTQGRPFSLNAALRSK